MTDFYFEVGEEVILQSNMFPNLNGNAFVLKKIKPKAIYTCLHCGKTNGLKDIGMSGYMLNIPVSNDCCTAWGESALRKKHKPGESFEFLMQSIKSGEGVE